MQGFFNKKETESIAATGGKVHSCASCGLYKHCRSPKMKPSGNFKKDIMIIGNAPDEKDDEQGSHWTGKKGRLLKRELKKLGIDLFEDCLSLNAVNCLPNNKRPERDEIAHCRSVIVWKALKKYQPKVVLLLGQDAVTSVIGQQWSGRDDLPTWRGFCIPDQDLKTWVCPTFAPEYLLRIEKPGQYLTVWRQDLERALNLIEKPLPRIGKVDIQLMDDCKFLEDIPSVLSSFDYETTGIKPHMKGHRIVCVSISTGPNHAYVFEAPKTKAGWQPFRKWLHNRQIPKMAHNMKFEHTWSKNILKVHVRGWEWDSMIAAHIIDNRKGITGLKFQTYARLGVPDYSTEVERYLKSVDDEHGANSKNRIVEAMKNRSSRENIMEYCGYDSVYQYRLALMQMEELEYQFLPF